MSPSSLVRMVLPMPKASSKACAALTASWLVMASITKRISWGLTSALMVS